MKKPRGYDLTIRKLSLDDARKAVLLTALTETEQAEPPYARDIYKWTKDQLGTAFDRIMLSAAQVGIVKVSLERYQRAHGECQEADLMLKQLDMNRKDWNAYLLAQAMA